MKKKLFAVIATGLFAIGIVGTASAATTTWNFNGHQYEIFYDSKISWLDAADSLDAGWHLATVTSQDEQDFIEGLLTGYSGEYWLGGFQPQSSDQSIDNWSWVTGENWAQYTNWEPTEPNDYYGNNSEHHLAMWKKIDWQWNDEGNLNNIKGYVAESSPVPEPATMLLFGTGLVGLAGLRRKKKV